MDFMSEINAFIHSFNTVFRRAQNTVQNGTTLASTGNSIFWKKVGCLVSRVDLYDHNSKFITYSNM